MVRARFVRLVAASILSAVAWASAYPMNSAFAQVVRRGGRWSSNTARESVVVPRQNHPLDTFLKAQQRRFVRESINDWNCYTWDDLASLRQEIASGEISQFIEADPDFDSVCNAMKQHGPAQREGVYRAALQIFPSTWAQQGFIGPPGQTDAGQQAAKLIGQLVVQRVRQQVGQSPQQESTPIAPAKVGDILHAVSGRTPVQVGTVVVTTINAGEQVTVVSLNGPWVGVAVTQDGRQIHGWIQSRYLAASGASDQP